MALTGAVRVGHPQPRDGGARQETVRRDEVRRDERGGLAARRTRLTPQSPKRSA